MFEGVGYHNQLNFLYTANPGATLNLLDSKCFVQILAVLPTTQINRNFKPAKMLRISIARYTYKA